MKIYKYLIIDNNGEIIETENIDKTLKKIEENRKKNISETNLVNDIINYFIIYEDEKGISPQEIEEFYGIESEFFENEKKYILVPKTYKLDLKETFEKYFIGVKLDNLINEIGKDFEKINYNENSILKMEINDDDILFVSLSYNKYLIMNKKQFEELKK